MQDFHDFYSRLLEDDLLRRYIPTLMILFLLLSPLSARSLGYGVSFYGQTIVEDVDLTTSGVEFSLVYKPYSFKYFNPSLVARTAFGTEADGAYRIPYVQMGLSVDLLRTINHKFNFLSSNVVAYTPALMGSVHFDPRRDRTLFSLGFSPFKLSQKDFWYEFFSGFVTYDLKTGEMDTWGINLVRYTYLFK